MSLSARAHSYLVAAALLGAVACKSDPPSSAKDEKAAEAKDEACARDAAALGWLASVAESPKALEGAGGGWVPFYRRDYREAIEKLSAAGDEDVAAQTGVSRAHVRLGVLHTRLARLVARGQVDYFAAREALGDGAKDLRKDDYFHGVAKVLAGDPEAGAAMLGEIASGGRPAPAVYRALARAWTAKCEDGPRGKSAFSQIAFLAKCAAAGKLTCPDEVGAPPYQDPWKTRAAVYHAALCADPFEVDEARLTEMASTPVDSETVKGSGDIDAEIEYFDPVALWALGQLHLRRAEKRADVADSPTRLVAAWAAALRGDDAAVEALFADLNGKELVGQAFLMADVPTGEAMMARVKAAPEPPADPEAALAKMRAEEAKHEALVACVASDAGKKVVAELGLTAGFARSALRRDVVPMLADEKTCEPALRLLRATQDIKNLEATSYVNEPAFLVSLAEAALCMRRSAEAIGTLKTVKEAYPEAEAALAVAQGLSVVRLMGGTGGTQKVQ